MYYNNTILYVELFRTIRFLIVIWIYYSLALHDIRHNKSLPFCITPKSPKLNIMGIIIKNNTYILRTGIVKVSTRTPVSFRLYNTSIYIFGWTFSWIWVHCQLSMHRNLLLHLQPIPENQNTKKITVLRKSRNKKWNILCIINPLNKSSEEPMKSSRIWTRADQFLR